MENIVPQWLFDLPQNHLLLISIIHIITWCYCLTLKGWVSDDIAGIAQFSDRFVQEKDPKGNIIKEYKIDSYDIEHGGKKLKVKNIGWCSTIGHVNAFQRWSRLNLGKRFQSIGTDSKGHTIYGWVQDARRHHAINIVVQLFNLILGYNLLSTLFGSHLAFIAILLFSVNPCSVQTVGWISGVNYLYSLFFTLLTIKLSLVIINPYVLIPVIAFTTALSGITLLPGCLTFIILLILGKWNAAIISFIVGSLILVKYGSGHITLRINAFKEQQMGKSTSVNLRKSIIIVKTLWYYIRQVLFPKRLGLFHTWGYHFDEPIEHINGEFWLGLISLLAILLGIIVCPLPVRFGLIWFLTYLSIFSNIITANQFVSERYAFIPTLGTSLLVAYLLRDCPIAVAFIVGVFIMRIWVHLPTFRNEVTFYESNVFNFPTSEVAMGNLGVSYLNHGMGHKAIDTWNEASRQNALYDVPWYNLYSICKQNGDLYGARKFLMMCLNAKTVHFPDQWKKEMIELDKVIANNISIPDFTKAVNARIKEANYGRTGTL